VTELPKANEHLIRWGVGSILCHLSRKQEVLCQAEDLTCCLWELHDVLDRVLALVREGGSEIFGSMA
jgi:hypothetical protein